MTRESKHRPLRVFLPALLVAASCAFLPDSAMAAAPVQTPVVTGLHTQVREMLCTTIHDASPEHRYTIVESSIFPFLLAVVTGASFIGFAFTPWAIPLGITGSFLVLFGWFWSNSTEHRGDGGPPLEIRAAAAPGRGRVYGRPCRAGAPRP